MATYFLSRRDERKPLRSTSDVLEEFVLDDEPAVDIEKVKDGAQVTEASLEVAVPILEHWHPTHSA